MAHLEDCATKEGSPFIEAVLEFLSSADGSALTGLIRQLLNSCMLAERQKHLQAAPYERTEERQGHANGFKDKTVKTRLGEITFSVPQVREGGFAPRSLEEGLRSERALKVALAEMYVQGVSTRNVAAITEKLCGFELSSTQVSRAAAELDGVLAAWRERPLAECPYLYLDARYEQVRVDGQVRDVAVLVAVGVGTDGKRQVLGVSVSLSEAEVHWLRSRGPLAPKPRSTGSEAEVHWRTFLQSLHGRGLSGVKLVVSDDHSGLKAARRAVFGGVPWQRCQFHLQQNAGAYVPKVEMRKEVANDIRAVFNAPDRAEADSLLKRAVQKYERTAPKLSLWMETNLPEGLSVFSFPEPHRRLLRTTNGVERSINQEIRRRTRVARLFPNEASCLRLVSALLMEISGDWQTGKAYLTFSD